MTSDHHFSVGYSLRPSTSKDTFKILQICYFEVKAIGLFYIFLLPSLIYFGEPFKFLLIGWGLLCIAMVIFRYFSFLSIIKLAQSWVIECDREIVACAVVKNCQQYSELFRLYVKYSHRNKGLGTCLVKTLLKDVNKPVYVVSVPKALYFYRRLGFVPIPKYRLPQIYSQLSRQGSIILGFIKGGSDQ